MNPRPPGPYLPDTMDTTGPTDPATAGVDRNWPAPLGPVALTGLAGDIVRTLAPHTESDPAALLFQFLTAFGNCVNGGPHFLVENTRHPGRLFTAIVGESAKARKGTSWQQIRALFEAADEAWAGKITGGLSSGEGLIWAVRDPSTSQGKNGAETVDEGVPDKRLLVVEGELASVLKNIGRESNILSVVLRNAWDSGKLRTLTKSSPVTATGAHISVVGHITLPELRRTLAATDQQNGFANRFLWVCARRSQLLPDGGSLADQDHDRLCRRVALALAEARKVSRLTRTPDAGQLWHEIYAELADERPGLAGAVTSRAEAQVLRLSLLYALLEGSPCIDREHLLAARECWRYCEDSARFIFGDKLDNAEAEVIRTALASAGERGLGRLEIIGLFSNHLSGRRLDDTLALLAGHGFAYERQEATGGRPASRWFAGAKKAN